MTIGAHHLEWLSRLATHNVFEGAARWCDLGPQDVEVAPDRLRAVVARHGADEVRTYATMLAGAHDGLFRDVRPLYEAFGCRHYEAVDLHDLRARYRWDLNAPVNGPERFDIVTNFGTLEHLANIGEGFNTAHKMLATGGLLISSMVCQGFLNHGYYAVQPGFYADLAKANSYEIVDLLYVDDIHARDRSGEVADLDTLPIRIGEPDMPTKAAALYAANVFSNRVPMRLVHDHVFAALRRTAASPPDLWWPVQGIFK